MRRVFTLAAVIMAGFLVFTTTGCTRMVAGTATIAGAAKDAGVTVGGAADGAAAITVFIDFGCPFCKKFEEASGGRIAQYVDEGRLAVTYRPVSYLDQASASGDYSSRAAASLFLVARSGVSDAVVLRFITEMYRQQPEEGEGNLTNGEISAIAAGAGASSSVVQEISGHQVDERDHMRTEVNEDLLNDHGLSGVPGIIDESGNSLDPSDSDWLSDLVGDG